jgi:hypothetical protein
LNAYRTLERTLTHDGSSVDSLITAEISIVFVVRALLITSVIMLVVGLLAWIVPARCSDARLRQRRAAGDHVRLT